MQRLMVLEVTSWLNFLKHSFYVSYVPVNLKPLLNLYLSMPEIQKTNYDNYL